MNWADVAVNVAQIAVGSGGIASAAMLFHHRKKGNPIPADEARKADAVDAMDNAGILEEWRRDREQARRNYRNLSARLGRVEWKFDLSINYAQRLREHIIAQLAPPPPPWPDDLFEEHPSPEHRKYLAQHADPTDETE